jgi:hypothetical protein
MGVILHRHGAGGYYPRVVDGELRKSSGNNPQTNNDLRYHRDDNTYPECNEQVVVSTSYFNTALEFKPLPACHSAFSGTGNNADAVVA